MRFAPTAAVAVLALAPALSGGDAPAPPTPAQGTAFVAVSAQGQANIQMARGLVQARLWPEAAEAYLKILAAKPFLVETAPGEYRSGRLLCFDDLRELPTQGRDTYERLAGSAARAFLGDGASEQPDARLHEAVRRFPLTAPAREALVHLAARAWERGEATAAYAALRRLAAIDPADAAALRESMREREPQPAAAVQGHAFDPGDDRWTAPIPRPAFAVPSAEAFTQRGLEAPERNGMACDGARVFAAGPSGLHAWRLDDGQSAWSSARVLPGPAVPRVPPPVLADGDLAVATIAGRLLAVDARSGKVRWTFPRDLAADAALVSPGASVGGRILALRYRSAARDEGTTEIVAIDARTGAPLWTTPLTSHYAGNPFAGGRLAPAPAVTPDGVVVADGLGHLAGVDPDDGTVLWQRSLPAGAPRATAPAWPLPAPYEITDGTVAFVAPGGTDLLAIRAVDGAIAWTSPLEGARWVLPAGEGRAILVSRVGAVLLAPDGSRISSWNLPVPPIGRPAVLGGSLWVAESEGIRAYAIPSGEPGPQRRWRDPPTGVCSLLAGPDGLLAADEKGIRRIDSWDDSLAAAAPLDRGELFWLRGRLDEAALELAAALAPEAAYTEGRRAEAESLLARVYVERSRGSADPAADLQRAIALERDGERLLTATADLSRALLARGDVRAAAVAWQSVRIRLPGGRVTIGRHILPAGQVAGWWLGRLSARDDAVVDFLETEAERALDVPAGEAPDHALRNVEDLFPETDAAAGARLELAHRLGARLLHEEALALLARPLPARAKGTLQGETLLARAEAATALGRTAEAAAAWRALDALGRAGSLPPDLAVRAAREATDGPYAGACDPVSLPVETRWTRAILDIPGGPGRWLHPAWDASTPPGTQTAVVEGRHLAWLDAASGVSRWRTEIGEGALGCACTGSSVLVWGAREILALDAGTGRPRWLFSLPRTGTAEEESGPPVTLGAEAGRPLHLTAAAEEEPRVREAASVGGTLLLRAEGNRILALREEDGRFLWQRTSLPQTSLLDSIADGGVLVASHGKVERLDPANGRVQCALDQEGILRAFRAGDTHLLLTPETVVRWDPASGRPLWKRDTGAGRLLERVTRLGQLLYRAADDGTLRALDLSDGRLLWSVPLPDGILDAWVGRREAGFLLAPRHAPTLRMIDLATGATRWEATLDQPAPAETWLDGGEEIWIWQATLDGGGRLTALDRRSGRETASIPLPGRMLTGTARVPGGLLAATDRVAALLRSSDPAAHWDRILAERFEPQESLPGADLFLAEALLSLGDLPGGLARLDAMRDADLPAADRAALGHGWREVAALRTAPEAVAVRFTTPMVADGRLDEPHWLGHESVDLSGPGHLRRVGDAPPPDGEDEFHARLHFGWDDAFLYIGIEVEDATAVTIESDNTLTRGDGVLLAIDGDHSGGYSLPPPRDRVLGLGIRNPPANPPPPDQIPPGEYEVMRRPDGAGTVYEAAIPWSYFAQGESTPGRTRLGINLAITDDDGKGVTRVLTWSAGIPLALYRGQEGAHQQFAPALFGDVTFGE